MSSYRRALKRTRAELARDRGGYEVTHTGKHPLRKVRVGDRVQVRAGEVLTIVTDAAGSEVPLGHVQAGQSGVFVIEAEAAKVAAKIAAVGDAGHAAATGAEELDDTLARVAADRGRGSVPGHPGCERLP